MIGATPQWGATKRRPSRLRLGALVGIALFSCICATPPAEAQSAMKHAPGMHHGGMHNVSMIRHRLAMHDGIDAGYAAKTNPLEASAENVSGGKSLYDDNCAACHGAQGRGDGEAGAALSPPPADVAMASKLPMATDAYLYWTIAEGGAPVGSAMPPFKATLSEQEIWKIVTYLREL